MTDIIFFEIGIIIIVATLLAFLARLIRQPIIPAYILAGVILGPVLGIITNSDAITILSEIGIAFLLFIVGLEIDLKRLTSVALISSLGGSIRSLILFIAGFLIAIMFGFIPVEAIYLGLVVAFSSTMIVVKLLSDKRELDTLHARVIVGILLMEDFLAIIALTLLATPTVSFLNVFLALVKVIVLILIAAILTRFVFPLVFKFAAKLHELLFLSSISVLFLFSLLAKYIGVIMSYMLGPYISPAVSAMLEPGLSIVIGAFIGGVVLANLPYSVEIIGQVKPLRDFFATIFFVSLGLWLVGSYMKMILIPLIVFLLFVMVAKPMITMFISSVFGYKKRTSFLTSLSLAQVSEFSLIIVTQGMLLGQVSSLILCLTVMLAVITMVLTSYSINFDQQIYSLFSGKLSYFERLSRKSQDLEYLPKKQKIDVILVGHNRIGYSISNKLNKMRKSLLVVDFNPEVVRMLMRKKVPCIYGDIGDREILERLDFKEAEMVIATVPEKMDSLKLVKAAKKENRNILMFVTANQVEDALELYNAGADYVILPHFLGGEHVSLMIEETSSKLNRIIEMRFRHIQELRRRVKLGHKHPEHRR